MLAAFVFVLAQLLPVQIAVDADADRRPVSPYIYGMNNAVSAWPGQEPNIDWQRLRDAGVRLFRENNGNNGTKYNWRRRLSSHPDWYNNVYPNDWDHRAQLLQDNLPGARSMWAFQLIGYAAETDDHNFDDWNYNGSQWWEGVRNNWAGGGGPDGTPMGRAGDPDLYLTEWPADSTVGILDHWFGDGGLGLDPEAFVYWNMDNEPEIWSGTHDGVMPQQLPAEDFMQRYFEVAKKARALYPGIKLAGPVAANEWQWYNWNNDKVTHQGRRYPWLEYFIKRIGEEQAASGVRLLDVLDLHFYPDESAPADIVQLHRIWFDPTYDYPGANGVKRVGPSDWNATVTKEYVFGRARAWLEQYLGPDHGVTLGVSEMGIRGDDPNVTAVWYASTLGVFADEGVELFTPWDWKPGMWEVLHLFSRYGKPFSIRAESSEEVTVSAHASLNAAADSLIIFLINRSLDRSADVRLALSNFAVADGAYPTLTLADLPPDETFVSHTDNALTEGRAVVQGQAAGLVLPPLSITALLLSGQGHAGVSREALPAFAASLGVYPNPLRSAATVAYDLPAAAVVRLDLFDLQGRRVATADAGHRPAGPGTYALDGAHLPSGVYVLQLSAGSYRARRLVTVVR